MSDIKVGDVVQLRSGGPHMTITDSAAGPNVGRCTCAWYGDTNQILTAVLPVDALTVLVSTDRS